MASSPIPQCSSYWKGSFRVTLDYGRQFYFFTFIRCEFFTPVLLVVSHRSLSDSKSPWLSNTLLSSLADISKSVVCIASIFTLIFNSSRILYIENVSRTSTTITFVCQSFSCSLSFIFALWSAVTAKFTSWQVFLKISTRSSLLTGIGCT